MLPQASIVYAHSYSAGDIPLVSCSEVVRDNDIYVYPSDTSTDGNLSEDFPRDTHNISRNTFQLDHAATRIGQINNLLFLDAESYAGHQNTTELSEVLAECNKNVIATIQLLNKIKNDTQATRTSSSSAQDTTMRDELVTQLQAKFLDATNALLNAQTKYKFDIENVVKAEVHRLNCDATDEEIDAALVVTNRSNDADYTIRSGRAALLRPTLYGTSTPDLVKGTVLAYPDLPLLTGSLSELQQSFYYYVLLPTSSSATLSNSVQPLQAIGTRPVSDNEASEMHLLQNGHFSIMRQRRNRALFGFFLIGGLIAYLFLSRKLSVP